MEHHKKDGGGEGLDDGLVQEDGGGEAHDDGASEGPDDGAMEGFDYGPGPGQETAPFLRSLGSTAGWRRNFGDNAPFLPFLPILEPAAYCKDGIF